MAYQGGGSWQGERTLLRTDSLSFLLLLVFLSLPAAYAWTTWVLPPFNSDHLGCDACHHAMLVYTQSLSSGSERAAVAGPYADYPQTSHFLAAQVMPVLQQDPYKAMRFVSFASVLIMLACQFHLVRRAMPAPSALLVLLLWQLVCYQTNTADPQFYSVAYFYSQAIGMMAVWPALALFSSPASSLEGRLVLAIGGTLLAAFAYLCHIVSGAVAFGALGSYSWIGWAHRPNRDDALRLVVLTAAGLVVVLGTDQLAHMARSRICDGSVPLKNLALLCAWIPTLLLALTWRWRRWRGPAAGPRDRADGVIDLLVCLLAAAGGCQAYCLVEWAVLGKSASYSAKKFYYVLFPAAALLWFLAASTWLQTSARFARLHQLWASRERTPAWGRVLTCGALAGLLAFLNFKLFIVNELQTGCLGPDHHPVAIARQLQTLGYPAPRPGVHDGRQTPIYFDPDLPESNVFINVIGLRRSWEDAFNIQSALRGWKAGREPIPARLKEQVSFSAVLLPGMRLAAAPETLAGRR
jgi:hypothetical protein